MSSKKSKFRMVITALGVTALTPVLTIPALIAAVLFKPGRFNFFLLRIWNRVVAKLMGLKFSISGMENVKPDTSYIITPNHQGIADMLALGAALPLRFRGVVKRELYKIPFWGWALWATGTIGIDRSNTASAVAKLNREKDEKLKDGWSVLIYPEGTRTPDGFLQEFKKGAFMMAVQTGIPILPVVCNGAFKILPKKMLAFRPGHIKLTICPPILTKGLTEKDVPALMARTRDAILSKLLPDYDPFAKNELCANGSA